MSPLAILLRHVGFENLAGDFKMIWEGSKCLLGDMLCGEGEATPRQSLKITATVASCSHREFQDADYIKTACLLDCSTVEPFKN